MTMGKPVWHPTRRRLVLGLLDHDLTPRYHNGVGFAQIYLAPEVRLHIWHPDLPTEPEAFGCRHSHRFDFQSAVLLGSITNIFLEPIDDGLAHGYFDIFEVQPAHLGSQEPAIVTRGVDVRITAIEVTHAGGGYDFPKGVYHESHGNGITATVMKKLNQEDAWAGILAPRGQPPKHGMAEEKITKDALVHLCVGVIEKFDDTAFDMIDRMLS